MDFFTAMRISATGLTVQRTRMNVTASNLANAETTRTEEGGPYRRRSAVVAAIPLAQSFEDVLHDELNDKVASAEVVTIAQNEGDPRMAYNPEHPDANEEGYVAMPDVNVITEMVDLVNISRAYEANVSAMQALKAMSQSAMEIGE
jgi:flagellar basal-body rod protein FlgC